jgi:hypothetical protein
VSSDITMYDTILNSEFPPDAAAYAAYVDGGIGNQPNYAHIVAAFPKARHLSVALFSKNNADALDVEPGAAWPAETAIAWYAAQRARGLARPCLYASVSTRQEFAVPVIGAGGIPRAAVRLWTAHYGKGEHICGPKTCRQLSIDADGTQWTANALGRDLDQSLLLGDFFNVPTPTPPTPPANWTYGPPLQLRTTAGHTTDGLSWEPPAGAPAPVSRYQVYIYAGTDCSRATLVRSYPRGTTSTTWEGGSLKQGKKYTAHVVAAGAEGTHVRPYCYASATFTTG